MLLEYINWHPNPEIFRIGSFAIRWYGLLFALGFYLGYLLMKFFFKKEQQNSALLDPILLYVALGTIIGARLGHCLFYEPEVYLKQPLEILFIWKGGLASHGAAIGIILSLILFSKIKKLPILYLFDRISLVVPLGGGLIRIGNLMNSEIFGVPTQLPWAFIFSNIDNIPRHPTQIYEALFYFILFAFLLHIYLKNNGKPKSGIIFGYLVFFLFLFRFFIEFIKENQVTFEDELTLNMGQYLSLPFIIASIVFLLIKIKQNHSLHH